MSKRKHESEPTRSPDPRDPLRDARGEDQVLLLDGGLATHIEELGEKIDHSLWSALCLIKNPSVIRQAHEDFYAAGARVAITASYQAHLDGFRELGVEEPEALAAMKRSVQLAREVAPLGGLVAGSLGAYGASLHNGAEYTGEYPGMDRAKLLEWHRPRALALREARCDLFACETVPCLMEAEALSQLVAELKHPAWITFSCKSHTQVSSGEPIADCVRAVAENPWIVGAGVNCTHPKFVKSLVEICRAQLPPEKSVVVYPNSGEVWNGTSHSWETGTATADSQFVDMAQEWYRSGASCIGGCCRTTPRTIKALAAGTFTR
ncbi:unnamed protein product [Durusdinium trenchii]|uniref:Hcy-binding domain-containing protein n=1 Tax=Durusdinium trenchii TaxID=1381693 RepID=A0ABP0MPR5_9DINO